MDASATQSLLALKAWHDRTPAAAPPAAPPRATNKELLETARAKDVSEAERSRAAETLRRQIRSLCAAAIARQAPHLTPGELDDLVQDVLIRLLQSPPATDPNPAYVARVAANLLIDYSRRRVRRGQERGAFSLDDTEDGATRELPDPEADVEETVLTKLQRSALQEALGRLLKPTEAIVVLRRADGIPHEEIAAELGLTTVNVRKQAERGMKRLKEHAAAGRLAAAL